MRGVMKIKAASLVLDFNLYPRHHIDEQCVADYANAYKAGAVFPSIIAEKKSRRVVDGFKRTTSVLRTFGQDAEIEVEWRTYPDEQAVLLEAITLNAQHGERFQHYDIRRCIVLADELKLSRDSLASALHVTVDRLERFAEGIHIVKAGGSMPGKQASEHIDEPLTRRQVEGIRKAGGGNQVFMVNQVINLIEGGLLDQSSERLMERLAHLSELLKPLVRKMAA